MNLLFSCVGRRSYLIDYFKQSLTDSDCIIGTSNSKWASALQYCDKRFYMPDIVSEHYIDAMLQLCQREKVDAVLSFLDQDVEILAQHHTQFKAMGVQLILPSAQASHICFDKFASFHFLQSQGFNTPLTFIDLDLAKQALSDKQLNFPLIVKPRFGCGSQDVFIATNREEMQMYFHSREHMMIQAMLQGEELGMDICNDIDGKEVLSVVPWKKLLSRAGEVEISMTIDDPHLINIGIQLGKAIGQAGPMDVDFFKHEGAYYIVELNPRFGGGYPVTQLAGADYPNMLVRMLRGEQLKSNIGEYQIGVVMTKEYTISQANINPISQQYVNRE